VREVDSYRVDAIKMRTNRARSQPRPPVRFRAFTSVPPYLRILRTSRHRSSLNPGSTRGRAAALASAQPVAYIQRVIRFSLAKSMRIDSSRGVW
jgi:hypothetical protein